jgi:hypothetical protein
MRREDVRPLLEQAARRLPTPDLADAAWHGGLDIRRRRRRGTAIALVVVLAVGAVAALLAGVGGGKAEPVPPSVPSSAPVGTVPRSGVIAGLDFWLAPPAGSERFLDGLDTPLGDSLRAPNDPLDLRSHPVVEIVAVVLAPQGDARYRPMVLDADGRWGQADVDLVEIRNGTAGFGPPLSPASVSPDGRLVAFAQPGSVVLLDATTAKVRRIGIPSKDLRSVSWLPDSERVLVSGKDVAYRVLVGPGGRGERPVTAIAGSSDPAAVTAPYRLEADVGQVSLVRYAATGGWSLQGSMQLPVRSSVGQTFTAVNWVARVFLAPELPQVATTVSWPQVVAAISTVPNVPSRLLVLGETPSQTPGRATPEEIRAPGCCSVLGWYDEHSLLVRVVGHQSGWILAWDLRTGQVQRVTELEVGSIALGPGVRN